MHRMRRANGMSASSCFQHGNCSSCVGTTSRHGQAFDLGISASGGRTPSTCDHRHPLPHACSMPWGGGIRLASGRDMIPRAGFKTANTSLCCHGSAAEQTEPCSCSTGDSSNEVCAPQALCVVPRGCGGRSPFMACASWAISSRHRQLMNRTSA